jgi:50S ribosomal protein L16 3-hydroxylase
LPLLAESIDHSGVRFGDAGVGASEQPGAMPGGLQAFARTSLRKMLAQDELIDRALGQWITEPKPKVWFESGAALPPGRGVALDRRSRVAFDSHDFYLNGESYRVSGQDARCLAELANRRALPAQALRQLSAGARAAVQDWVLQGWVHASVKEHEDV